MDERYRSWIKAHSDGSDLLRGRGRCEELSNLMTDEFPELRIVGGYYECPIWGRQHHWWCVTPDGQVVDPTAAQFPSGGLGEYKEVAPQDRPIGVCMDCGGDVFPNPNAPEFCSDRCRISTIAYLNRPYDL